MKKFRRILGRCALGAFLLAAVYSILVAAGVLFPAPPVVPAGPMFVPELSQEQEERFAEQKKRYGTLFLTVSSAKPFTVTNHAGDTARVDPRGDVTGDLKVYQANRYESPLDGRIYTVGIEVCGSEEIIVDLERQQGRIDWTWEEGGGEGELSCCVNGPAMERVRIYPDRRLQIADTHRRGRDYTVSFTNHYRMYELGVEMCGPHSRAAAACLPPLGYRLAGGGDGGVEADLCGFAAGIPGGMDGTDAKGEDKC